MLCARCLRPSAAIHVSFLFLFQIVLRLFITVVTILGGVDIHKVAEFVGIVAIIIAFAEEVFVHKHAVTDPDAASLVH